jgi:hypothetical protein
MESPGGAQVSNPLGRGRLRGDSEGTPEQRGVLPRSDALHSGAPGDAGRSTTVTSCAAWTCEQRPGAGHESDHGPTRCSTAYSSAESPRTTAEISRPCRCERRRGPRRLRASSRGASRAQKGRLTCTFCVERTTGFEPATPTLARCSRTYPLAALIHRKATLACCFATQRYSSFLVVSRSSTGRRRDEDGTGRRSRGHRGRSAAKPPGADGSHADTRRPGRP